MPLDYVPKMPLQYLRVGLQAALKVRPQDVLCQGALQVP